MIIDRALMRERMVAETERFVADHPLSAEAHGRRTHLLGGVPMPWMTRWPGPFPIEVAEAHGGRFTDVDGHDYVDFCLGDTGAMVGHSLPQVAAAVAEQAGRALTTMLPSPDAAWVAQELTRRFGLPTWQLAMTATDANRFVLRFARHLTGRPKVAVFDWCYHGTVDETFAVLDGDRVVPRPGALGPPVPVDETTVVVPFNDVDAIESALSVGDVACVLMEPAMTNIGIVRPADGFLTAVREVCDRTGTLLVIDETHTICVGPGGATAAWRLIPDFLVVGKVIGGGFPVAAYGMSSEVASRVAEFMESDDIDVSGVGGTLTGNALAVAAVRATLSSCLLSTHFERTVGLATSWADGVTGIIAERELPWTVQQLGCRAEYWFCPAPTNGAQAAAAVDHELDAYMHLFALNRGILLTPFHNMALICPFHTNADVDLHTQVFSEAVDAIVVAP